MGFFIEVISAALLMIGSVAVLVSGIGIIRMPDVFTRLHAVGITDTAGAAAVLLGLLLRYGWDPVMIKILFLLTCSLKICFLDLIHELTHKREFLTSKNLSYKGI